MADVYIYLNDDDCVRAKTIGAARQSKKPSHLTRRKSDVFSDDKLGEIGMLGELALACYLGVDLDENIYLHGDGGVDFVFNGLSFAVKFTHRRNGSLMVEGRNGDTNDRLHDLKADAIVLTHGICVPKVKCVCNEPGPKWVCVAGWLPAREFMQKRTIRDLGLGTRHMVDKDQLRPMSELVNPLAFICRGVDSL